MPHPIKLILEFKRVIGFTALVYLLGKTLKRKGIKYTSVAAIIGIGALLAETIGNTYGIDLFGRDFNAMWIPAVTALLTFGLGNILTGVSNLFSFERILTADANAINLMEDRKKADMEHHLAVLWDRVFKYEAALNEPEPVPDSQEQTALHRDIIPLVKNWPETIKADIGLEDDNLEEFMAHLARFRPDVPQKGWTRQSFIASAAFSLRKSLPQKLERSLSGFDLSLLEDWYDGACFTLEDCKLKEQYAAHKSIHSIRREVGISFLTRIKEALSGHPDPLWYTLTMKKIGMSVGNLIDRMNRQFVPETQPNYFNAQDFLWISQETDSLILHHFGDKGPKILQELITARRNMIRSIFSPFRDIAHQQICRMFGNDYQRALELSLDYDVEFAAGLLDKKPLTDIRHLQKELACPYEERNKVRQKIDLARENIKTIDNFLQHQAPELLRNPLQRRAVRIGYHINAFKVRPAVAGYPSDALDKLKRIAAATPKYSQRICLLRQHYELARIQLLAYVHMVDELGDYEKNNTEL